MESGCEPSEPSHRRQTVSRRAPARRKHESPGARRGQRGGRVAVVTTREDLTAERALQRQVYEAGYAGIDWPAEYGGQGLTQAHARAFAEESHALPHARTRP